MKNNSLVGVLSKLALFGVCLFAVHFLLARSFPVCAADGIYAILITFYIFDYAREIYI